MTTTENNLPRDVFLYLLMVIALGMLSVNLGNLLFQYINVYVPDVLADQYMSVEMYYSSIRWAMATLLIVFPVFLWVMRFIRRDTENFPHKRELKIRKWLLYLTLFIAGTTVIGDLVALVYSFLQGELTTRFILKVLVILAIAGSVFYYYFNELRTVQRSTKILSWAVVGLTTIVILAGFLVAGLPQSQRLKRFDERRVSDLQNIQWQVINYWQKKNQLPGTLDGLTDDITGYKVPLDPATGSVYEYQPLGQLKFQLCATFETASYLQTNSPPGRPYPVSEKSLAVDNWSHLIGRTCFDRIIDPQLYPPVKTN